MHLRTWPATALAFLTLGAALAALTSSTLAAQADGLRALDGEWIFLEDRTEGHTLEQLGPPMASKFSMRVEEGAVVLNGHGSGHRDVRIALDGSITEVKSHARSRATAARGRTALSSTRSSSCARRTTRPTGRSIGSGGVSA